MSNPNPHALMLALEGAKENHARLIELEAKLRKFTSSYEARIQGHLWISDSLSGALEHSIKILKRVAPADEADLIEMLEDAVAMYQEFRKIETEGKGTVAQSPVEGSGGASPEKGS